MFAAGLATAVIVAATAAGLFTVEVVNPEPSGQPNPKLLKALPPRDGPLYSAALSPDGELVVAAAADDPHLERAGRNIGYGAAQPDRGSSAERDLQPDGKLVVTASVDGTARFWRSRSNPDSL